MNQQAAVRVMRLFRMVSKRRSFMNRASLRGSAPAGGSASKFIKDDKDMVLATYAGLAVVVILANLITGGKKEDKPAPMASSSKPTASSDGMPGLDTPAFEEWVAKPGNFEKIFDMLEQE
ncbi:hypothetical protein AAMO2058_001026200 [Amorphochlora amoebiformis]|mmetsp:Transcript_27394/g.43494  ORF Transcript_27394/g.43494 Transcript_27394/m.43494 type:complete len:120 (-) Transcript_27394:377-736(-)